MSNLPYPEYATDVRYCQSIHRQFGKSFYFGTRLLPAAQRDATCVLYAFFRLPDEFVDTERYVDGDSDAQAQSNQALQKLEHWQEQWAAALDGQTVLGDGPSEKVIRAARYIFQKFSIPRAYSEAFLSAMIQDVSKQRYANYDELRQYMYGSASVVGQTMTYVFCANDKRFREDAAFRNMLLEKAGTLGEALQLTNFLRDVNEDYVLRNRIYIPEDAMRKHGVNEEMIRSKTVDPAFIALMKDEIVFNRRLYSEADLGIALLPAPAARAVRVARVLYAEILVVIEQSGYNVFQSRAHLSFLKKLRFAVPALIKKP